MLWVFFSRVIPFYAYHTLFEWSPPYSIMFFATQRRSAKRTHSDGWHSQKHHQIGKHKAHGRRQEAESEQATVAHWIRRFGHDNINNGQINNINNNINDDHDVGNAPQKYVLIPAKVQHSKNAPKVNINWRTAWHTQHTNRSSAPCSTRLAQLSLSCPKPRNNNDNILHYYVI